MENQAVGTRDVSLRDLWQLFLKRAWIMAIAAVAAIVLVFAYINITFVPQYQSTATVYILSSDPAPNQNVNNEFALAITLMKDCSLILKSHAVLDEVAARMEANADFEGGNYEYEALKNSITINNPEESRILEIKVRAGSPEEAKAIVDEICNVGGEKVKETMRLDQVNVVEYGTLDEHPSNVTGLFTYLLVGILAAIIVYIAFLVFFIFDDRIRDNESIEECLHLTVLGDIPDADDTKKGRKGYYKYKSRYGYGAPYRKESAPDPQATTEGSDKA